MSHIRNCLADVGHSGRNLRSKRHENGLYEGIEHVVYQGEFFDLTWAGPIVHLHTGLNDSFVVKKRDNVLIGFFPEPAALFIMVRAVNCANTGLRGGDFKHRRAVFRMPGPDVLPSGFNLPTLTWNIDVS